MKKTLMVSTIIGFLSAFEISDIKILQSMGYEVHCAGNCEKYSDKKKISNLRNTGIVEHHIPFVRSPFSKSNIKAYKELKKLMKEEHFDLIHCHTPVGGVLARLAARKYRRTGTKVIYTAHGFHFYDGAPLKNWLLYYPVEKWLSRCTDVLIAINKEDYKRAKEKFKAKRTVYIPGVGVDTDKFKIRENGRERIRAELGLKDSDSMLLSVGELNENKNHETVIRAIKGMNVTYVIVGIGDKKNELEDVAKECGVDLRLTGYRNDVADFYDAADVYVLPSIREGLNVSLMEAMASGLACVCGRIRGNTDLVDEKGGILFDPRSEGECRAAIEKLLSEDSRMLGNYNVLKISNFSNETVNGMMRNLYESLLNDAADI